VYSPGRIAEGSVRAAADHQVDPFGFACIVVAKQELRVLGENGLDVFAVAIGGTARRANDLLGWYAVYSFRVLPRCSSW
jgi:hypothetical protein